MAKVVLIFLALLSATYFSQSQAPEPTVEVAAEMDLAPSNCGILAESIAIDPIITHAIGTWPIWLGVPNAGDDPQGIMYVPDHHNLTHPDLEGWWSTKAGWFVPLSYTGEVHLQAVNVADDSPIYFEFSDHEINTRATLNPAAPGGFIEDLNEWAFFPSTLWLSKAGCYRLEATWDGGLWQQSVAVGNIEDL